MTILYRDYETPSSTLDVSDVGARRYATHPETEIQCCAFAVDDEPVKLWSLVIQSHQSLSKPRRTPIGSPARSTIPSSDRSNNT
jgi:hypothetical protein